MKNLIKEIEKALQDTERLYRHTSEIYNGYLKSHYRGKMEAYMNILESLKDYNLITAPKQIKLSEIVDRLEKSLNNPKNKVNVYRENGNEIVIKITYFARGTFVDEATIEMSNKIWDIDGLISARYKWLYTLWIAGTEIIDDLEEE